ncbi:hypothetical protein GCM10010211_32200 [Streptomyces albospinus]|uniref:Uncharacterized protein n=1 Tax=Streptomyces albospinus TaxID=285515 RepID=A0ABQ2V4L2_9ACTN|nr:hypothetical protein GCM10010211_32200 [Streptomyces albospinus]
MEPASAAWRALRFARISANAVDLATPDPLRGSATPVLEFSQSTPSPLHTPDGRVPITALHEAARGINRPA